MVSPRRIIVGDGVLAQAGHVGRGTRHRGAGHRRRHPGVLDPLLAVLDAAGVATTVFSVTGVFPAVQTVIHRCAALHGADLVGMGGGSVIDTPYACAAHQPGRPAGLSRGGRARQPLGAPAASVIAILTTAGAGAEVTKNAVLSVPDRRVKVSLRHNSMLPAVALVDPTLTHSLPPAVTAATGMDALTQCLEPFVSHLSTPLTDGFCREGMARAARCCAAVTDGQEAAARYDMAVAAPVAGWPWPSSLGAVHGFAGPLGGMVDAPHGALCARLLPLVMAANVAALKTRDSASPALTRYDEAARILTGDPEARAVDGVAWVETLCADLAIPGLGTYGLTAAEIPAAVAKGKAASSMKGNPIAHRRRTGRDPDPSAVTAPTAPADLPADPYVRALARLFRDDPVWVDAMKRIAVGAGSNVYFTHLPEEPWHFIKTADGVRVLPGRVAGFDFVFRFTPAAIVAFDGRQRRRDAVAVTLFDLMLDPDPARHVDFRIVAFHPTGAVAWACAVAGHQRSQGAGLRRDPRRLHPGLTARLRCVPCAGTRPHRGK
ncbi:MAG: iron-containing alcohol dehydrogenase [Caldilineaceae bacterium]